MYVLNRERLRFAHVENTSKTDVDKYTISRPRPMGPFRSHVPQRCVWRRGRRSGSSPQSTEPTLHFAGQDVGVLKPCVSARQDPSATRKPWPQSRTGIVPRHSRTRIGLPSCASASQTLLTRSTAPSPHSHVPPLPPSMRTPPGTSRDGSRLPGGGSV